MASPHIIRNNVKDGVLEIVWEDAIEQRITHAGLRNACRCSECQSLRVHTCAAELLMGEVTIEDIRLVGSYGVQLIFSDQHDRGIFPWNYLRQLDTTIA